MKNKYLLFYIVSMLGFILIILGLLLIIIDKDKEIKKQDIEINRLLDENDSLWDNYYMNVTNQDGYEYYE